ncbi:outer membrane protein, OMP85 family [Durotheca rogersii]|uniref:outer membrane protein, OMP85 family n=1 Tax=Durotheca rogersii TaxID=419775 RepID=UPI00221F6B32|nr:outer membrane protein, OMP85 family [Durotheca rogersii]KAI5856136.1 outer membrane protein, OMP85 family [Durotheca rogersii]
MARNALDGEDDATVQVTFDPDRASPNHHRIDDVRSEQRTIDLLSQNKTLPVTLSSIYIHGAKHTRKSFLDPLFEPLVQDSRNADYTLADMLEQVGSAVERLHKFDIFQPQIVFHLSRPPHLDPSSSPTDLDVSLRVRERPRFLIKTGTDMGNTEGSAYGYLFWRNVFGGAESLSFNASAGTRTRSAYRAEFSTPLKSNPDLRLGIQGLASNTQKPWASHDEVLKGGSTKLEWLKDDGDRHQISYSGTWRQVTGLGDEASPAVRRDAGDSTKSAVSYTFQRERRDNPFLPQSGYFLKTATELAGWGPLGGDVGFSKSEVELAGALPVPLPGIRGPSGVSIGGGLRAGLLYPLPLSYGLSGASPSRINDRFTLGGPTDVRGFSSGGLGPRDGGDSLGGDVFAAGSVNVLIPLPRVGPESPLRFQLFANGGRLVALRNRTKGGDAGPGQGLRAGTVRDSVIAATRDLGTGLPSIAAGVGLVYAHPMARFELNFSLPLVMRRGEDTRKGLQIGVGINFL